MPSSADDDEIEEEMMQDDDEQESKKSDEIEEESVLDWEDGVERIGGNGETLVGLGKLFLTEAPRLMHEIQKTMEGGDARQLRRAAHTLKGSADVFSAGPAVAAALAMERIGKEGRFEDSAEALRVLKIEIDRLIPAIEKKVGV